MKFRSCLLIPAALLTLACQHPIPITGTGSSIWIIREEYGDQSRTQLRYTDSAGYTWPPEEGIKFLLEYRIANGKVFRVPCRVRTEQKEMPTDKGVNISTTHTVFEAVVPTRERPVEYRIHQDGVMVRAEQMK